MCLATKAYEQETKMCTWGQPTRSVEKVIENKKLQPDFSYELKHNNHNNQINLKKKRIIY